VPAVVLLAGGTICHEMREHFKNQTAAVSRHASRQFPISQEKDHELTRGLVSSG
jgi:hypothetical protein